MKSFIVALALVAVAAADVSHILNQRGPEADAQIVQQDADVLPDQFRYEFKTSNGIASNAQGNLQNVGNEPAISVQGTDSYTGPDGVVYQTSYIADANGYQPQGAHLPTPHPIPELIARSLEYIAAHPQKLEPNQRF